MLFIIIYCMSEITIDKVNITTTFDTGTKKQETIALEQIAERIVAIIGTRWKKPHLIEIELPLPVDEIAARPISVYRIATTTPSKQIREVTVHIQSKIVEIIKDELIHSVFMKDTWKKFYKLREQDN